MARSSLPLLLAAVLALAGCRATLDAEPEVQDPAALLGPTWSLIFFSGPDGDAVPFSGGASFTISFGAHQAVNGRADCNTFAGRYEAAEAGRLSLDIQTATRNICPGGTVGATFLAALRQAERYDVSKEVFHVYFADRGQLSFAARP